MPVPELGQRLHVGPCAGRARGPAVRKSRSLRGEAVADEPRGQQLVADADHQPVAFRFERQHVQRLRCRHAQALALAHRVVRQPAMPAQDPSLPVDDRPRQCRRRDRACLVRGGEQEAAVVVRHETDLLAVATLGDGQAQRARRLAHLSLVVPAQWKDQLRQQRSLEAMQEIRLVLVGIETAPQPRRRQVAVDARIVTGCRELAALASRQPDQFRETHAGVAGQARIGRSTSGILSDERRDHPLPERFHEVAHPVGGAVQRGQSPRLVDGFERAARLLRHRILVACIAEIPEGDAFDATTERLQHGQRHSAVDAAAQAEKNPCAGGQSPAQGFG
jgi:hypothetical protein